MDQPQNHFVPISFWELLGRYRVEIPIIQRDYAQGREGRENLRELFLATLFRAVSGDPQELDFIYGDLRNDTFCPLDGQQRLTTLFLLHCYAARKESVCSKAALDQLGKFTYETRISSRDFSQYFVSEKIEIDWSAEKISPFIRDSSWFFINWDADPTISGMLTMLDDIHQKFRAHNNLWSKLTDEGSKAIQFNFVPLNEYGLSDDLYIKMNARGRPLTAFENFKARIEKKITDSGWDEARAEADKFLIKVDTVWTDLFWTKASRFFDEAFLNFINHVLVCSIAAREVPAEARKNLLSSLLDDPERMAPNHFERDDYESLYRALDVYSNGQGVLDAFELQLSFWKMFDPGNTLFVSVVSNRGPQYVKRILLHAQTIFFIKPSSDPRGFEDWMRVVRNIVQNTRVDTEEAFIGAIALVNELSEGCANIYEYLVNARLVSKFASEQMSEERRKAAIIKGDPEIKSDLHRAEDNHLCLGRISFALYCVNENENDSDIDPDRFKAIVNTLNSYFSSGINDDIRRALLTIDGNFFKYWRSWLFAVNAPKYCLIKDDNELRKLSNNHELRRHLKELVLLLENRSLSEVLNRFTPDANTPEWRIRLIREPKLLAQASQKFFALSDDHTVCYLIPRSRVANDNDGIAKLIPVVRPDDSYLQAHNE